MAPDAAGADPEGQPAGSLDPPRAEAGEPSIAAGGPRPTAGAFRRQPSPRRRRPPTPSTAASRTSPGRAIAVAAEAATLGVRLLSRAVEAVRKPADRR